MHGDIELTINELKREKNVLTKKVKELSSKLSNNNKQDCANEIYLKEIKKIEHISTECAELIPIIDAVDKHLGRIVSLSSFPKTIDDYIWICDATKQWEYLLLKFLNISRKIPIKNAPSYLLPRLDIGDAFSEEELDLLVDKLSKIVFAYSLLKGERKLEDRKKIIGSDIRRAEIFLANDILDGTLNFAKRVCSSSFYRLEKIWMAEVRELLAYLKWLNSGEISSDPDTEAHYFEAWEDFKKRIIDFDYKVPTSTFGEVKQYLEDHYVSFLDGAYKLNKSKIENSSNNNILKIKSEKARVEVAKKDDSRYWDNDRNWIEVEKYVEQYYENIIPAVMNGDKKYVEAVIHAFDYSMNVPYRIINAFEMAIVIYFINKKDLINISFPNP